VGALVDPDRTSPETLATMHARLEQDLSETLEMVRSPRGKVLDPASLGTAEELLEATLALLRRGAARSPSDLAREINVAYAVMLAGIDLVKSHTDVPWVPPPRPAAGDSA
jgi:hypothetical protein